MGSSFVLTFKLDFHFRILELCSFVGDVNEVSEVRGVASKSYSTVYLRFRVPDSVIPLKLEGVNLSIDIQAEDRRVEFATVIDGELNPLQNVDSPREKFNFEIVDAKALELNSKNEWVFAIKIDRLVDQTDVAAWRVKDVKIEMSGKTL